MTELNRQSTVDEFADAVYSVAVAKDFHPPGVTEDEYVESLCNNLHDEVSELHEAWRNNQLRQPCDKAEKMVDAGLLPLTCVEEELADLFIRVLDDARQLKVDIVGAVLRKHQFNQTRPSRHGNKRS